MLFILLVIVNVVKKLIVVRYFEWDEKVFVFCIVIGRLFISDIWYGRIEMYSKKFGVKIRFYDLWYIFVLLYFKNGGFELSL